MKAVVAIGNGGYDQLVFRDVPIPQPAVGEELLKVLAAGVNNTEINTRLGWYSASVSVATSEAAVAAQRQALARSDGGWSEATLFPFIQGTDCCGRVVAAGAGVDARKVGTRVPAPTARQRTCCIVTGCAAANGW